MIHDRTDDAVPNELIRKASTLLFSTGGLKM
jgi:hypothetical protein